MINATITMDGSWPGEVHALVLSKILKVRIVIVQNNYDGLVHSFDSDNWYFEGTPGTTGLSETMRRKAPDGQKTCYLLQTNSKIPPFMCDWENNFNHFVHLQKSWRDFILMIKNRVHTREGAAQMMTIAIHFIQTCGNIY
jgi:hypothetical protein